MRLAPKLALSFLLVVVAVFTVHALLSVRWHIRLYEGDSRRDQARMGHALALAAETTWRDAGPEAARALVERANESGDGLRVSWVPPAADAPPASGARTGPAGTPLRQWTQHEPGGRERLFTRLPLRGPDGEGAALELSEPVGIGSQYIHSRILLHVESALAMVLLSTLASLLLGERFVARPVRALVAQARRIGDGDLAARLALPGRDEFAELAREMNAMAAQLEAARQHLEKETTGRLAVLEQLRHADRLTTAGKLASGLAHELGTPLNVISERARMIESGEAAGADEVADSARVIIQQTGRVTHIVRQLLDLARRRTPEPAATDLAVLVRSTLSLLAPLAEKAGVSLRFLPGVETGPVVEVDPGQMQQALTNVLLNAIEATPRGRSVAVQLLRTEDGGARIAVEDEGPGMAPEVLEHVFDPFFTTKAVGAGTGLGLSIAEGIVHEHGGRIDARNAPAGGSRFSIRIPGGAKA